MIIFNGKEYQGKYVLSDSMLLVINSNLSLGEVYDRLRKGEELSPEEAQVHAYMNGDGKVRLENDRPGKTATVELPEGGGVRRIGTSAMFNEDVLEDLAEADRSKVFQREAMFDAYEKMQFGRQVEGFELKLFPFDMKKAQHREVLRRHIALSTGAMPTIYQNLDLTLDELSKLSKDGANLYRDYGKGSVAEDNPLPSMDSILKYQALNEYEKRLISTNFVHPAKAMELKEALNGAVLTNDLYRKLTFFNGDVDKVVKARLANVNDALKKKFEAAFVKYFKRAPRVLDEFIQGCRDLYKIDEKSGFTDEKVDELVKEFDLKSMQAVIQSTQDASGKSASVTVATCRNPVMIALSREIKMAELPQQLLRAMSVYIDQNNADALRKKGIVEWIKANKNTPVADFVEMIDSSDIIEKFDEKKSAKDLVKSLDVELGNRDAKLFAKKYGYKPEDNIIAIKGRHLVVQDGQYKMYMLSADDPRNFVTGYDTCCCQRWDDTNYHAGGKAFKAQVLKNPPTSSDNAGGSCVYKLTSDPYAANVVIENAKGEVVAQSFVWTDELSDTFVFDNIEYANDGKSSKYVNLIGLYAKHLPYANVQLGMGCNDNQKLNGVGEDCKHGVKMPTTLDGRRIYSDYHAEGYGSKARDIKRYDGRSKESKMVRFPLDESRCRVTSCEDEPTKFDVLTTKAFSFLLNDYKTPIEDRLQMVERFKNNPDEALQMEVVRRDPRAILAVENPGPGLQMEVWRLSPEVAKEIENPCEELQVAILEKDPNYLRKAKSVSEEVICSVMAKNGLLLSCVPEEKRTIAVCESAGKQSGYAWKYVPDSLKSEELAKMFVESSPKVLSLLEPEFATKEVQMIAARKEPSVILLMECSIQSQMAAVSRKPDLVLSLKDPALPVVKVAVERNPGLIRKYQHDFPSLRMEAIQRNGFVAKDLRNLTAEEYDAAVAQNPRVARFVQNPRSLVQAVLNEPVEELAGIEIG